MNNKRYTKSGDSQGEWPRGQPRIQQEAPGKKTFTFVEQSYLDSTKAFRTVTLPKVGAAVEQEIKEASSKGNFSIVIPDFREFLSKRGILVTSFSDLDRCWQQLKKILTEEKFSFTVTLFVSGFEENTGKRVPDKFNNYNSYPTEDLVIRINAGIVTCKLSIIVTWSDTFVVQHLSEEAILEVKFLQGKK